MQLKPYLVSAWKSFLNWRRKNMPFRLTILLLIFASLVAERLAIPNHHGRLINELVGIAIQAMRYGSEPRVSYHYLHYFEAQENCKLQQQLNPVVGKLTPSEIREINRRPSRADFNVLYETAQRTGIIPALPDLRQTKMALWAKALKSTHDEFGIQWDELQAWLFKYPSSWTWEFWHCGVIFFLDYIWLLLPWPIGLGVAWFVLSIVVGFMVAKPNGKKISGWSILVPVVIVAIWLIPWPRTTIWYSYCRDPEIISRYSAYCLLAAVAGIWGYRLKVKASNSPWSAEITAMVLAIGGVILANGYLFHVSYKYCLPVTLGIRVPLFIPFFQIGGVLLIVLAVMASGRKCRVFCDNCDLKANIAMMVVFGSLMLAAWLGRPAMTSYTIYPWLGVVAMILGLLLGGLLVSWKYKSKMKIVSFCLALIMLLMYGYYTIACVIHSPGKTEIPFSYAVK